MNVPRWLAALIGGLVIVFGVYRIKIGFRSDQEDEAARQRGGLYAKKRWTHLVFGALYLVMGALIFAKVFGFDVFPRFGGK